MASLPNEVAATTSLSTRLGWDRAICWVTVPLPAATRTPASEPTTTNSGQPSCQAGHAGSILAQGLRNCQDARRPCCALGCAALTRGCPLVDLLAGRTERA